MSAGLQGPSSTTEHLFLTGHPSVGKTTIIVNVVKSVFRSSQLSSSLSQKVFVRGFYTEECRSGSGDRVGFDIVSLHGDKGVDGAAPGASGYHRAPLSRIGKPKKGDPAVGKYIVDVDSVQRNAIPSIETPASRDDDNDPHTSDLVVIDEVGKMELLCPSFLPAVKQVLDSSGTNDDRIAGAKLSHTDESVQSKLQCCENRKRRILVLGTIPTPRYGRVIKGVEELRARADVTVVQVTKSNRDELGDKIQRVVHSVLGLESDKWSNENAKHPVRSIKDELRPYLYERVIGASSAYVKASHPATKRKPQPSPEKISELVEPCGPLLDDSVPPKVLILGETASPRPLQPGMEYSERSMWTVLREVFPASSFTNKNGDEIEKYLGVKNSVLKAGIGIWDVLSDVHHVTRQRKKGQVEKNNTNFNNFHELLRNYPSICAFAFVGKKAMQTFFRRYAAKKAGDMEVMMASRNVQLVILPSSSPANSKMTVAEKGKKWKDILSLFCPTLKE